MIQPIEQFSTHLHHDERLGIWLDTSLVGFAPGFVDSLEPRLVGAYDAMAKLEAGAIANADENRMVGHYWLRAPELAPSADITNAIRTTEKRILDFAADVHAGRVKPASSSRFRHLLVIGIGGSALGPELVAAALGSTKDAMKPWFFDNTDPDGFDRTIDALGDDLATTMTVVISKSGGTKETRNGMLEAKAAYERRGLDFSKHAVAVTGEGSELDRYAKERGFLARFPMWDWVGGRTSELSAVGLLPAALQGIDVEAMLRGARWMDEATRSGSTKTNLAGQLAAAWYSATSGSGKKDMVLLPYKDRLELFSRYAQQLVMESLGKRLDRQGKEVWQGISVYGNKGSTDQHAYVQQLRDGIDNFFVTFIEVLEDRAPGRSRIEVEPRTTSGDYLAGFFQGTRRALAERGRASITITLETLDAQSLGALIALYERTVGIYAELIDINAYHQPGVEAGKKAAAEVIDLMHRVVDVLEARSGAALSLAEVCEGAKTNDAEAVFLILRRLSAGPNAEIERVRPNDVTSPLDWKWMVKR
ncbi:MAG: glucose-6-phosphate isomerase [Polyangiaceae bacterium]|nr:glucose-6-phosphate isomerase [Polyangiaceae bacterium]